MVTRRQVIQAGTVGGAALLVPAAFIARQQAFADPVPGGTLDPTKVPKYVLPLFVLPAMPGGRDMRSEFKSTPGPYRGPVPTVVHLHGAHVFEENDGYPEAWYLPAAANIPSGFAKVGTFHNRFRAEAAARSGVSWPAGSAV